MDSAFVMPQLNRTRRIWVYLPENYAGTKKRYPVLYMHDGQNLFDAATSYSGEWGVDEALDMLQATCIVVGIDNGGMNRINEYTLTDHPEFGRAEGRQYLEFIVHTLKPYIDQRYRTKTTRLNTYMAGSSMGGLITFYAGMLYPKVFKKLGIFSPSFWMTPRIGNEMEQQVKRRTHGSLQYYFYAGGKEGATTISDMVEVTEMLRARAASKISIVTNPEGQHNEATWGREFIPFYQWLML